MHVKTLPRYVWPCAAGSRARDGCVPRRPESARAAARTKPPATTPDSRIAGHSHGRRADHHRRDRARRPRPVHRGSQEGRVRDFRRRRQAGAGLVHADARRARLQRRAAATAAAAGRHHPAADAADQRRGRPHLPDLRRRPAPRLPQHRPHSRPVQEDLERADSRRRHVRHRLDRARRRSRSI